ncbi:MAG: rhodanese-like domain-containing protein [Candidatus Marinimicrobia bacterium]|nr:rhodanese-like domain-containing protein [Candidatus Neomarinimicrobiota bacterium]
MLRVPLNQMLAIVILSLVVGIFVNIIRSDSIPLFAKEIVTAEDLDVVSGEPVSITLDQAKNLFDKGVVFVDARDDEYFKDGHIPNAWNSGFFMELMFKLDSAQTKNGPVVLYCSDDECGSSEELANDLFNEGFTKLFVFKGGWLEWEAAGYPVE